MSQQLAAMPPLKTYTGKWAIRLSLRHRLIGFMALVSIASIIVSVEALNVYDQIYTQFQQVALDEKGKIEQADQALQLIAQVSTDALDSVITRTANPTQSRLATQAVNTDFDRFRQVLVAVDVSLEVGAQTTAYTATEQAVYDQFWPHLSAMQTAEQHGDMAAVVSEYTAADQTLEQIIVPDLSAVEQYHFMAMQRTEQNARTLIIMQVIFLLVLTGALAIGLIALSAWLRSRLRRYLTPGLDAAMLIGGLCAVAMFIDLIGTPAQLKSMVEDSYFSVGAAQRILAIAVQANRTESAEVLDVSNVARWQTMFDQNNVSIEQAICGFQGCTAAPFLTTSASAISPAIVRAASQNLPHNADAIVPVVPLVANVTYAGEAQAIEQIRLTYRHYLAIDGQIRADLAKGQITQATLLDTGDSDVAFNQFTAAVQHERQINLDQFEAAWQDVQSSLPVHRVLFGLVAYLLIAIGLWAAVYQRYPEL